MGFCLVAGLRQHTTARDRLADVPSLMNWQILIVTGVSAFVLAPPFVQWLLFFLGGSRMLFEAVSIHRHRWTALRLCAVMLSPILPLVLSAMLIGRNTAAATLLVAFFLAEVFDSFSYLGGKVFGRNALVSRLSPNKTWEGLIVGATVTLFFALVQALCGVITLWQAAVCTLTTIVFATVGDLTASFGKRTAGVKDYPLLIAGQGGLLDMFDAWIYVAPMTFFALRLAA